MKPTLIVKLPTDIEDPDMTFLLMSLQMLDSKFNLILEGFKGVEITDDIQTAISKTMARQMEAKI